MYRTGGPCNRKVYVMISVQNSLHAVGLDLMESLIWICND